MTKAFYLFCLLACMSNLSFAINYPQNFNLTGADWTLNCANQQTQSPINIETEKVVCDDTFDLCLDLNNEDIQTDLKYHGNLDFFNHSLLSKSPDHFVNFTYQLAGNFDTLYADNLDHHSLTWNFKQMHFHSPSQHLIDGQRFDFEVHLVHELDDAEAAKYNITRVIGVIGILFSVDDDAPENPFVKAINFADVGANINLNLHEVLYPQVGRHPAFYGYKGSLTGPPCDPIVNFYVLKKPLKMTTDQLKPIINMLAGNGDPSVRQGNDRIPQPLYGRVVRLGNANCNCPVW